MNADLPSEKSEAMIFRQGDSKMVKEGRVTEEERGKKRDEEGEREKADTVWGMGKYRIRERVTGDRSTE